MPRVQKSILAFFGPKSSPRPRTSDGSKGANARKETSTDDSGCPDAGLLGLKNPKKNKGDDSPMSVELFDDAMIAALHTAETKLQQNEDSRGRSKSDPLSRNLFGSHEQSDLNGFKRGLDVQELATPVSARKKRRAIAVDSDEDYEPSDVEPVKPSQLPNCAIALDMQYGEELKVTSVNFGRGADVKTQSLESSTVGLSDYSFGSEVTVEGDSKAREKLIGAADPDGGVHGEGKVGPSWVEKHPWAVDIRDKNKKRPGEEGYDKTTLYVPEAELASGRGGLTPFQKQFWKIKKDNYDVIIFFKKGKFYEMYDKDADVGHHVLNLNFTKGGRVDMRCCGVPEQSFEKHVSRLIDLGYKVGRVEQTETINAVKKRKAASKQSGSAVCERSLVRILTKSTVTDEEMLRDHKARYLLAIKEDTIPLEKGEDDGCLIGVCYIDAASGSITVGEYEDDYRRSSTEKLITYLSAPELIIDTSSRGAMSGRFRNLVRWMSDADEMQLVERVSGFPLMTPQWLQEYLSDKSTDLKSKKEELDTYFSIHTLASQCLGAAAVYLKSLRIDKEVLSMGNYSIMASPRSRNNQGRIDGDNGGSRLFSFANGNNVELSPALVHRPENAQYSPEAPQRSGMSMDASTLTNLEIVSSTTDGSTRGTLLSYVDHGKTAGGRRLLRKWLSSPLYESDAIIDRLNAVESLLGMPRELLLKCQRLLAIAPDLSRALAKIYSFAVSESRAVMFDDSHNRRVKAFIKLLRGLESVLKAFDTLRDEVTSLKLAEGKTPRRLLHLLTFGGAVPDDIKRSLMYFFKDAFDFDAAESNGEIHPRRGVVPEFDGARDNVERVKDELEAELQNWRSHFKNNNIKFYHRGKEPYQLEVPLTALDRYNVPRNFTLKSTGKGVQRYWTHRIQELVEKYVDHMESFDRESESVTRSIFGQFARNSDTWDVIASSTAEVDALISLALTSQGSSMTRPEILPNMSSNPILRVQRLRHPILSLNNPSFVPNDTFLGNAPSESGMSVDDSKNDGDSPSETALIITGPNMGGKSTLSRQVALSAILAQIGCFVPAEHMVLRPLDAIFVRMGACDRISRGRSTFMVELEETSAIIDRATSQSLVVLDELGRGTSTHDGFAIAHATLSYLLSVGPLVLFSTHYTRLANDFKERRAVGTYEMQIAEDESKGEDGIIFLYQLGRGVAKYSRGISCARMAGVPDAVCAHAATMAEVMQSAIHKRPIETEFIEQLSNLKTGKIM